MQELAWVTRRGGAMDEQGREGDRAGPVRVVGAIDPQRRRASAAQQLGFTVAVVVVVLLGRRGHRLARRRRTPRRWGSRRQGKPGDAERWRGEGVAGGGGQGGEQRPAGTPAFGGRPCPGQRRGGTNRSHGARARDRGGERHHADGEAKPRESADAAAATLATDWGCACASPGVQATKPRASPPRGSGRRGAAAGA